MLLCVREKHNLKMPGQLKAPNKICRRQQSARLDLWCIVWLPKLNVHLGLRRTSRISGTIAWPDSTIRMHTFERVVFNMQFKTLALKVLVLVLTHA